MLFKTLCVQALLLAVPSAVLGSAIPHNDRDVSEVDADVSFESGIPEFSTFEKRDSVVEAADSFESHLLPRALTADESESLRIHNAARAEKNLKALTWDHGLWQEALAYAKVLIKKGTLEHASDRNGHGENLGKIWGGGTISNPKSRAAQGWVNEKSKYHGEVIPQGDFQSYGHYTQVMWKSTTKVGIASATDGKGTYVTVARYAPAGNFVGQKPY